MNADLLCRMASGFHKTGVDAAWRLRGTGPDAFRMIGPAAVNLALAAELYLKAVHLLNGRRPLDTHELWKLFKTLPRLTVELLGLNYSQALATTDDELKSMHMVVSRASEGERKTSPQLQIPSNCYWCAITTHLPVGVICMNLVARATPIILIFTRCTFFVAY